MFTKEKDIELKLKKLAPKERDYILKITKVHHEMKKEHKPLAYIDSFENALTKHSK